MHPTIVCYGCDERLTDTANAMRRHASEMHKALDLIKAHAVTDEVWVEYTNILRATLNDAQSAWDAYRAHLIEHGLVAASSSTRAA